MNRANLSLFCLSVGILTLSILLPPTGKESTHTVETIQGSARRIERFDAEGKLHGKVEYWDGSTLKQVRVFEHGQAIEDVEYNADGSVKERRTENSDYLLERIE